MSRRTPSPRSLATLAVLALVATSLIPIEFTWFRGPLMAALAPASGPATAIGAWLRPGRVERSPRAGSSEPELIAALERLDRDLGRALARIGTLEAVIRDIQSGVAYPAEVPVVRIEAARVGVNLSSGTIEVSRGARHGVQRGSIALARGTEQLVGIVTSVGPLVSTVHLVTDRRLSPPLMVGVAVPPDRSLGFDELAAAPNCQLRPVGDGTLASDEVGAPDAALMSVGDRVRLLDDTWPSEAQMVVLGRIASIEPTDEPLFRRVVVAPEVEPARLRSVILQVPAGEGVAP
jgi:hypothetical protein